MAAGFFGDNFTCSSVEGKYLMWRWTFSQCLCLRTMAGHRCARYLLEKPSSFVTCLWCIKRWDDELVQKLKWEFDFHLYHWTRVKLDGILPYCTVAIWLWHPFKYPLSKLKTGLAILEVPVTLGIKFPVKHTLPCSGLGCHGGARITYATFCRTWLLILSPLAPKLAWHILLNMILMCGRFCPS